MHENGFKTCMISQITRRHCNLKKRAFVDNSKFLLKTCTFTELLCHLRPISPSNLGLSSSKRPVPSPAGTSYPQLQAPPYVRLSGVEPTRWPPQDWNAGSAHCKIVESSLHHAAQPTQHK